MSIKTIYIFPWFESTSIFSKQTMHHKKHHSHDGRMLNYEPVHTIMQNHSMSHELESEIGKREEEEAREHNIFSCGGVFTLLLFLVSIFFIFVLIYALFTFDTDHVKEACPRLHPFLTVRTVIGFIFISSLITFANCVGNSDNIIGNDEHGENCFSTCCRPLHLHLFLIMYFLVFCITGSIIVSENMIDNKRCVDSLHDDLFKTPLLGIIGWIYIAFDGLFSLVFIYLFISSELCSMHSRKQHENEQTALIPDRFT